MFHFVCISETIQCDKYAITEGIGKGAGPFSRHCETLATKH
uniref:Uncharacterized protein n=1 Tax=Anguilla anguilla TaxID=7936 RepID=A0A0E9QBU0_ANGAN